MLDKTLLRDAEQIFEKENRLIELPHEGYGVFVGDTHGDLDATQTVLDRYLKPGRTLVFLGDYVDRGKHSRKNIDLLLRKKADHPERLYLLQGNHEGIDTLEFLPHDFWDGLDEEERTEYGRVLGKLPYAASGRGLLALHGAPPDFRPGRELLPPGTCTLERINDIKQSENLQWLQILWADLCESECRQIYTLQDSRRYKYGMHYFADAMDDLWKELLIRSHDPTAPQVMLNRRCLTLMTTEQYSAIRTIAIADLGKETRTTDQLTVGEV